MASQQHTTQEIMKSRYEKEINEYLKNGGTIQRVESPKRTESDLLKESVTTVRDLEPHEVTAISWEQAMAETEEEREGERNLYRVSALSHHLLIIAIAVNAGPCLGNRAIL